MKLSGFFVLLVDANMSMKKCRKFLLTQPEQLRHPGGGGRGVNDKLV